MVSSGWQKQHINFKSIVWAGSGIISSLLIILLSALGFEFEKRLTGVFFFVLFIFMRVSLAFIFKNRFANSMVCILNFAYEEIERDFRMMFKDKSIRFYRRTEEDAYRYEFPGRSLSMIVRPHYSVAPANITVLSYALSLDSKQLPTKVTLYKLTAKNEAFAEMLADSIDEMINRRANNESDD